MCGKCAENEHLKTDKKKTSNYTRLNARSADKKGWGNPVQITGTRGPEGAPGPHCVAYVFVFLGSVMTCRLHGLTFSDKTQYPLHLRVGLFGLVSALARGPKNFLSPRPEPSLGGHECV